MNFRLRVFAFLLLSASIYSTVAQGDASVRKINLNNPGVSHSDRRLANAFKHKRSGFHIRFRSEVVELLSKHHTHGGTRQEFIVGLASGQTLLIVHNIEIATKLPHLKLGDRLTISGEYFWNFEGGEIHHTNRDASGQEPNGWIRRNGRKFE